MSLLGEELVITQNSIMFKQAIGLFLSKQHLLNNTSEEKCCFHKPNKNFQVDFEKS